MSTGRDKDSSNLIGQRIGAMSGKQVTGVFYTDVTVGPMSHDGVSQLRPFRVDSISRFFSAASKRDGCILAFEGSFLPVCGILSTCCGNCLYYMDKTASQVATGNT